MTAATIELCVRSPSVLRNKVLARPPVTITDKSRRLTATPSSLETASGLLWFADMYAEYKAHSKRAIQQKPIV